LLIPDALQQLAVPAWLLTERRHHDDRPIVCDDGQRGAGGEDDVVLDVWGSSRRSSSPTDSPGCAYLNVARGCFALDLLIQQRS
jgi:hypothetical protein